MTGQARGRVVHHDPASRRYEAPRRDVRPTSWLHRLGPVLDQGQINGCTGWTGADFLNAALAVGNRRKFWAQYATRYPTHYLGNNEGLKLYSLATVNDPFNWQYPPTDQGSSGLGVLKALKGMGAIDRYLWTFKFDQLLAWGQRQPVMLGTLWTDAMMDPDPKTGLIHIGTDRQVKAANDAGEGHEYLLRGVRWDRKWARIRNHWTADWGINGEAYIPLDELETLVMNYQGDVAVPEVAV